MRLRFVTATLAAALVAAMALVYNFSPSANSFYPRCPFYAATHWLCPGCGATRALYSLLHLDFRGALHYNALFTLLAPAGAVWCVFCCYRVMRYDRFPRLTVSPGVIASLVSVMVLFAIVRNIFFAF